MFPSGIRLTSSRRLLVRHPGAMKRLRGEILSVMGDTVYATRDQVRNLRFLACILKESTF